jgi:uncharacterized protein YndB with AHSA1/START domain
MKILKRIGLFLIAFVALALILAFFVNGDYAVEREVTINKPKHDVFAYVKYLKNQNNYSKWASMDPHMKTSFSGTDGTPGFVSAWESQKDGVGKGEQEIKKITEGERIDYELRFMEPIASTEQAYMITEAVDNNHTKVKWGFAGRMKYPMNLMCLVMNMDEMVGPDFEQGLTNLKAIMEKQ